MSLTLHLYHDVLLLALIYCSLRIKSFIDLKNWRLEVRWHDKLILLCICSLSPIEKYVGALASFILLS